MLSQNPLPTERTLRLLPDPILDTAPTEHMPASRHARIAQLLQTERALPLLPSLDPAHQARFLKIVARLFVREDGRVRGGFDAGFAHLEGRAFEKYVFAMRVRVEAQFYAAVDDGAAAGCAAGVREGGGGVLQRAV